MILSLPQATLLKGPVSMGCSTKAWNLLCLLLASVGCQRLQPYKVPSRGLILPTLTMDHDAPAATQQPQACLRVIFGLMASMRGERLSQRHVLGTGTEEQQQGPSAPGYAFLYREKSCPDQLPSDPIPPMICLAIDGCLCAGRDGQGGKQFQMDRGESC